jgi:hypothetical protein
MVLSILWRVAWIGVLAAPAALAEPAASLLSRPKGWVEVASESPSNPKSGYRVFEKSMPGSKYKAYRIEALVDAPPQRANAAALVRILDERFVGRGRERRILERQGDAVLVYFRLGAPMIDDRDAVTRLEPLRSSDGALGWQWRSAGGGPKPPPGVVRIPRSEGSWTFRNLGTKGSHVVYESFSELGGSIPAWIINWLMVSEQLRELETLRKVLNSHDEPGLQAAFERVEKRPRVGAGPSR